MKKSAHKKKNCRAPKIDRVKFGVIVLAVLISLIIFGKLIDFVMRLGKPFSPDSKKIEKIYAWDGKSVLNVVVKSDQIYILSFDPVKKTVLNLKIPDEMYISLPFSYGYWKMSSVYDLGQSENPGIGANLLKDAVGNMMGIPINGYLIAASSWQKMPLASIVDKIRQNPINAFMFLRDSKTDLSLVEFWQMSWGIRGARSDKIENSNMEKAGLASGKTSVDNSKVLESDPAEIDQFVQANFADEKIKDEGFGVGIYNATDHLGLAEVASRIVSNLGGRVMFTSNSAKHLEKSLVFDKDSYTFNKLSKIFSPDCFLKKSSCDKNEFNLELGRADINIFLGEDYYLRYNTK